MTVTIDLTEQDAGQVEAFSGRLFMAGLEALELLAVELGIRLGVNETPAIFVNGRRAPDVRLQSLQLFIVSELAGLPRLPAATQDGKRANGGD